MDKYHIMRDIIEKLNQITLTESVGLARRKPGDRWANEQGDEIIFSSLTFYPESGSYESTEELNQAIAEVAGKIGFSPENISWVNRPGDAMAFGLAHFIDDDNQDYYLGKYFKSISPNRTENDFSNNLPGGFRLQTGAAKKEHAGYKPSQALTQLNNLSPSDIQQQIVARFGADSDEARAVDIFLAASDFPVEIPQGSMDFGAFTNYFCEMLQPIALVTGMSVRGNADEAEKTFLTRGGFGDCRISFGSKASEGLTDSELTNSAGQSLGLSSKAASGAWASAKNLNDKVREVRASSEGQKMLDQHPEEVSILNVMVDKGYFSPLYLGATFGLIDSADIEVVRGLRKRSIDEVDVESFSPKLKKLYQARTARDPAAIIPFYHALAAVAFAVEDYVNSNTGFGEAAADILNFGAFMQAYTNAKQSGGNIVISDFTYQYPSRAVTGVMLRAGKTYYSTDNKGNFTFEILKNGAKPTADDDIKSAAVDTTPNVDLDQLPRRRSSVTAAPSRDSGTEKELGRKRRR